MLTSWTLPHGVLGFPDFTAATFTFLPGHDDLYGVLSDGSGTEFVLAHAVDLFPDYQAQLPASALAALDVDSPAEVDLWLVLTQRPDGLHANLRGPLALNRRSGAAVQVVLDHTYPTAAALAA